MEESFGLKRVKLTDCPDMTIAVHLGHKIKHNNYKKKNSFCCQSDSTFTVILFQVDYSIIKITGNKTAILPVKKFTYQGVL